MKKVKGEVVKLGRPTKYKPEYCGLLIKHMKKGGSFETFCAVVQTGQTTTDVWVNEHEDFRAAKRVGLGFAHKLYEDIGMAGMTGTLKRLVSERVARDKKGKPIYLDGKVVIEKVYAPAKFDSKVWNVSMRNRFGYRNQIELFGKVQHEHIKIEDMTDDAIEKEIKSLEDLGEDEE